MVHVLAIITTRPGLRAQVLEAFHRNRAAVLAEDGCIEYVATIDTEGAGAPYAQFGDDVFVVVEKWASLDALKAHGVAPHMVAHGAVVAPLVLSAAIHVLSDA